MSADPLDAIMIDIAAFFIENRDRPLQTTIDYIKARFKSYGEQCAYKALHPPCTCSKCTGRPDYEDIQDDIDEFMKEGDPS